jgi:hypothetical protein
MLDRRDGPVDGATQSAPAPQAAAAPADPITPVNDAGFDDDIPF